MKRGAPGSGSARPPSGPHKLAGPHKLTQGAIGPTLLRFALPSLGGSLLQSLTVTTNSIWIGQLLGATALSATANSALVFFLLFAAAFGLGMAVSILAAQAFGRGDEETVKRAFGTGLALFLCLSAVMALLGALFTVSLLRLLATPAPALPDAIAYTRVMFLQLPLALLLILFTMVVRGLGDSVTPLIWNGVTLMVNLLAIPLLIRGWGPLPPLGIVGAAYANIFADAIGLTGIALVSQRVGNPLRLAGRWDVLRIDPALARTMIIKGVPMSAQMFVVSFSSLVMIRLVNVHGVGVTAAYAAAQQFWTYLQMPVLAIGSAVSAMAAQNIGAGNWARVEKTNWTGVLLSLAVTLVTIALILLFDNQLVGLFLGKASGVEPLAVHIIGVTVWTFLMFCFTFVLFSTMRANGAVGVPLLILLVSLLPVRVGFAAWGQSLMGIDALWTSFLVSSSVSSVLALIYYRWGGWRNARMSAHAAPSGPASTHSQAKER